MRAPTSVLWLYGSWARGDQVGDSDIDVLAVGNLPNRTRLRNLPFAFKSCSISQYSWAEIKQMASYGSLFLHHVNLEGRPLLGTRHGIEKLSRILSGLGPYEHVHHDLESFRQVLKDVRWSGSNDGSPPFELSVLATLIRHAAILGCYILGEPNFARFASLARLGKVIGVDEQQLVRYKTVYQFRLHAEGKCHPPFAASRADIDYWCTFAERVLEGIQEIADGHSSSLPQNAAVRQRRSLRSVEGLFASNSA